MSDPRPAPTDADVTALHRAAAAAGALPWARDLCNVGVADWPTCLAYALEVAALGRLDDPAE